MSDNKLRCALVFRLEGGPTESESGDGIALSSFSPSNVTLLAKYDHATDGAGSFAPGKSYADAVGMVVGNDMPGSVGEEGVIGGFKVVTSDMHQVVYGADSEGLCECIIFVWYDCLADIFLCMQQIDVLAPFGKKDAVQISWNLVVS